MHSFWIGRLNAPLAVLIITFLTHPSFPGNSSAILPNFHCVGGKFSSLITTSCPIFTFSFSLRHFFLSCSVARYSFCHLSQKCLVIFCRSFHNFLPTKFPSFTYRNGGGNTSGQLAKKWPGVSACMSSGSSDSGVRGREFRMASIWHNSVCSCLYSIMRAPIIRLR